MSTIHEQGVRQVGCFSAFSRQRQRIQVRRTQHHGSAAAHVAQEGLSTLRATSHVSQQGETTSVQGLGGSLTRRHTKVASQQHVGVEVLVVYEGGIRLQQGIERREN